MSTLSFSDTEMHIAQAGPKLTMELKLTLDFWFSGFHLPRDESTGTISMPLRLVYVELGIKPRASGALGQHYQLSHIVGHQVKF